MAPLLEPPVHPSASRVPTSCSSQLPNHDHSDPVSFTDKPLCRNYVLGVLSNCDTRCSLSFCWSTPRGREPQFYTDFNGHSIMKSPGGDISPDLENPRSLSMKFRLQSLGDWVGYAVVIRSLCGAINISRRTSFYLLLGSRGIDVKEVDSMRVIHPDQVNRFVKYGSTLNGVLMCKGNNVLGPLSVPFGPASVFSDLALRAAFTGATVSRNRLVLCCGGIATSTIKFELDSAEVQGVPFESIVVSLVFVCGLPTRKLCLIYCGPGWPSMPLLPNDIPLGMVCSYGGIYPHSGVPCYEWEILAAFQYA